MTDIPLPLRFFRVAVCVHPPSGESNWWRMAGEQHAGDVDAGGTSQVRHEPEEIVIVGGGIGGLAFACALHR